MVKVMHGAKLQDWQLIDWQAVHEDVSNLRQRIFVASKENDLKQVANLQKLMLRLRANWLQSIRRVTQINKGRRTPGVDREVITTPEERVDLFYWLGRLTLNEWIPPPTRRVNIPKGKGKTRPLGIPTIRDRIIQAIVKNALEPFWEARFEATSYGFRPGRSTHDAIDDVHKSLCGGKRQWIVEADIKGAFDNINHAKLMDIIGLFPARFLIRKWLKAGVMIGLDLTPTTTGTPQGGIISPLLANIALHGMEEALGIQKVYRMVNGRRQSIYPGTTKVVRYADDLVILTGDMEEALAAKRRMADWLSERGLVLSPEKTQIVHVQDGFDFLGFTIRRLKTTTKKSGYILLTKPSNKAVKRLKERIRTTLRQYRQSKPDTVIRALNPLITGWGMYYRGGGSSRTFQGIDHYLWTVLWKWARRRHPRKGNKWIARKYFKTVKERKWVFAGTDAYRLRYMSELKIVRHVKVRDTYSPDDPDLTAYWIERRSKTNPYLGWKAALFKRQDGTCLKCGDWLMGNEATHIHHKDGDRKNNLMSNMELVHETCHAQITTEQRRSA